MRTIFLTSFLLFGLNQSFAQLGVIDDDDGFTNIRKEPSSKSEVIARIFNGDVFSYYFEDDDIWYEVSITISFKGMAPSQIQYYKEQGFSSGSSISGYMHKSRILPIDEIENIAIKSNSQDRLTLINDSIEVSFLFRDFEKENHKITFYEGSDVFVEFIDNKHPRGVDGEFPTREIIDIQVHWNGEKVEILKDSYANLFEPRESGIQLKAFKGYIFLTMLSNSDGAGAYDFVWILKNGKLLNTF